MTPARRALTFVVVALAGAVVWPGPIAAATPSRAATQVWYRQVLNDLRPLQSTLPAALDAAAAWASGSESATAARAQLARDLPQLERVQRSLENMSPLKAHATARDDFASGVGLYVESLRVDQAATREPTGALQVQLQHSYQRIRELGDIVFDQGTAELAPELGAGLAGPDVAASSHVPDWSADGQAPAPPLVPAWPRGGITASGSQPKSAWAAKVGMDGAPAQATVRAALSGHRRPADLARMAVALGAAEAYVASLPRPAGDQQGSNRLRLGLLVDAESIMSAEASRLSGGAPAHMLAGSAAGLGVIGGRLRAES